MSIEITPYLRNVLRADAAMSAAAALVFIAGGGLLASLTGLPQPLIVWAGLLLVPWVLFLLVLAGRQHVHPLFMVDVVAVNALWVAASVGVLTSGWFEPNALGVVLVLAQSVPVAGFAVLQAMAAFGRRRAVA